MTLQQAAGYQNRKDIPPQQAVGNYQIKLKYWGSGKWKDLSDPNAHHEATLLKLCCDKAYAGLPWHSVLTIDECLQMTAQWYKKFYAAPPRDSMYGICSQQIAKYEALCQKASSL